MSVWPDNQQLYDMQTELSKKMEVLSSELEKTQVMIRDYNGLRERLSVCEQSMAEASGSKSGGKDTWGYVVGGIGVMLALISYATR